MSESQNISILGVLTDCRINDGERQILDQARLNGDSVEAWQHDLTDAAIHYFGDEDEDGDFTWKDNLEAYRAYQYAYENFPLHMSAGRGDVEALTEALKSQQHDVNLMDEEGNTPLHYAAWSDEKNCALALLAAGADSSMQNNTGHEPIELVSPLHSGDVREVLLAHQRLEALGNIAQDSRPATDLASPEEALALRRSRGRAL